MISQFLKLLSVIVLAFSAFLFHVWFGGPFHPFTCTLFKLNCPSIDLDGEVLPGFENVQHAFIEHYKKGWDIGSCVVAYVGERKVVDLCGGKTDSGKQYRTAVQIVMSCTKAVAAIALAIQVDRGLISYDDKISKYWPEFAQANKENVTVSEWLRHKGGLAWLNTTLSWEVLSDHDAVASIMASQPHIFNGTSNSAYHSLTYGFVVNELIRRTDPLRRTLGQFIREEINEPLGIEFYLGSHDTRVLDRFTSFIPFPVTHIILKLLPQAYVDLPFLEPIPERFKQVTRDLMLSKTNLFTRSTSAIKQESFSDLNRKDLLMHEVGGFNGLSNAQSLAKLAAVMANHGKWEGARFISEKTMQLAHHSYPPEFDHVLLFNLSRTTGGFANWRERIPGAYGWAGYGGSFFIWNPTEKIGFAYVMNAGELDMFGGRGPKLYRAVLDSVLKK